TTSGVMESRTGGQHQRTAPVFVHDASNEFVDGERVRLLLLPSAAYVDGHRAGLRFAPSDDEHVGHLHARAFGNAILERLRARIEMYANAGFVQSFGDLLGVGSLLVGDRQHADLLRREPKREGAGEVLDQNSDKAL